MENPGKNTGNAFHAFHYMKLTKLAYHTYIAPLHYEQMKKQLHEGYASQRV
jgi:hypothetical protein